VYDISDVSVHPNLWNRLSYNTYRRGLFSLKDEDYRWAVLRTQIPPWLFQIVNLVFIAAIQNVLLMFLGVPAYFAATQPRTPLSTSDLALGGLALVVLATEFTADNQQFAYQTFKHAYLAEKKGGKPAEKYDASKQWPGARLNWTSDDAERGFITRGLWAYSRHPNFACELSFWVSA
jgi:steroid 5-alpha reductase family enzyme